MTRPPETSDIEIRRARAMARTIIEHHFGTKPRRIIYQASGLSNFVFLVEHQEGEFVVRLCAAAGKINSYIKEQWAISRAREIGVPTPEVLEVGNEVAPHPFMVSRRVPGAEATGHPNRLAILRELGRYARLINSIPTSGFGSTFDWSSNQLSRKETWKSYLAEELRYEARLEFLEKNRILTPPRLKSLRAIFTAATKMSFRPALNHGDLRLKNVLVDGEGKINAIIDWENCTSNLAPQWELSLALHDLSIDEKQEFLEGYGISVKEIQRAAPLIKALNLINYVPYLEELFKAKDKAQIEQYRLRLNGALDLYSF